MPLKTPKILSCFIDETGDFGKYDFHSPYYMVTAVLHDWDIYIEVQLNGLSILNRNIFKCVTHLMNTSSLVFSVRERRIYNLFDS